MQIDRERSLRLKNEATISASEILKSHYFSLFFNRIRIFNISAKPDTSILCTKWLL